jgi:DNA polymerase-3 subunit beta
MKLETITRDLLKALAGVHSITSGKGAIGPLSRVRVSTIKNKLHFYATDLEIFAEKQIEIQGEADINTTVPITPFYEIIRGLKEDAKITLLFKSVSGVITKMTIKTNLAEFSLPCRDPTDFPGHKGEESLYNFVISSGDLSFILLNTKHAISTDNARHYLNGGYLHVIQKDTATMLRIVSTDGHRLALAETIIPEKSDLMPGVILPIKCINELCKLLQNISGEINVGISKSIIKFNIGNTTLISKLIDAKFPDYEKVIPSENGNLLEIQAMALSKAVDLVSAVSSAKPKSIKITLKHNKLLVSVNDKSNSYAMIELPASYSGKEINIAFNAKYLLDILTAISSTVVKFYFRSEIDPVLIKDCINTNLQFILMPMRT